MQHPPSDPFGPEPAGPNPFGPTGSPEPARFGVPTDPGMIRREPDPSRSPRDPGTPQTGMLALLLAIVAASCAILWQNIPESTQNRLIGHTPPPAVARAQVVEAFSEFSIMGRLHTKLASWMQSDPTQIPQVINQLDGAAFSRAERVAGAIVVAELLDGEAALERLEGLDEELRDTLVRDGWEPMPSEAPPVHTGEHEITPERAAELHALRTDIDSLRAVYALGPEILDDAEVQRLETRYGFFGKVAATYGLENDMDAPRQREAEELRSGGMKIILLLLGFGGVVVLALLVGFVLLIIGAVKLGSGRWRPKFKPPVPGGSASLELYGVFVGAFFLLIVGTSIATARLKDPSQVFLIYLMLQWSLILIPLFWYKIRGGQTRGPLGLFATNGVLREVGWGVLMYLASVPLFALGVVVSLFLVFMKELIAPSLDPPSNPLFEMIASADPIVLVLLASLVTIWAPLCEEMVFRGALFRALRTRTGFFVSGLVSALLFAAMHSYGPLMLTPLIVLGFMFAFMREMRGSLIPAITAHCLHNTFVLGVVVMLISIISE